MNLRSSRDIFGAEIQYFRTDPRHWETILRRFADTGLRCVTTYVQWGTHLVGPPDVVASIYHALGLAPHTIMHDPLGRPLTICDGQPIAQLF